MICSLDGSFSAEFVPCLGFWWNLKTDSQASLNIALLRYTTNKCLNQESTNTDLLYERLQRILSLHNFGNLLTWQSYKRIKWKWAAYPILSRGRKWTVGRFQIWYYYWSEVYNISIIVDWRVGPSINEILQWWKRWNSLWTDWFIHNKKSKFSFQTNWKFQVQ